MSSSAASTVYTLNITDPPPTFEDSNNLCQYDNYGAETNNALECFLFKLPLFLQDIGMGYICIALCTVVIVTTVFGKIKESYKWFILNQAVWDLLVSYDFICARPGSEYWISTLARIDDNVWIESTYESEPTCFYSSPLKLSRFANDITNTEACYMLFLLSFSRFVALYFYHFYERNFEKKTIAAVFIFDLFFVVSVNLKNTNLAIHTDGDSTSLSLSVIEYIILLPIIPLSLIFTVLVLVKIIGQLKFQKQQQIITQRSANIRIAGVLVFQCITLIILFAFTSVYDFPMQIIPSFNTIIFKQPLSVKMPGTLVLAFKNNQKCINVIRVIIDSCVVLMVLSGYRRSILTIFRRIFVPCKILTIKNNRRRVTVTTISIHSVLDIRH